MGNNSLERKNQSSGSRMTKVLRVVGMVFAGLSFTVLFALVFGFLVKLIWNMLMPNLFGLSEITYWQAFGIVILAKLIFGGFGPRHDDHWFKDRGPFGAWERHWKGFEGDDIGPRRRFKDWKYYRQYWRDEGKAAFEAYMDRIEKEKRERESDET